jgi:hypothetical protein
MVQVAMSDAIIRTPYSCVMSRSPMVMERRSRRPNVGNSIGALMGFCHSDIHD